MLEAKGSVTSWMNLQELCTPQTTHLPGTFFSFRNFIHTFLTKKRKRDHHVLVLQDQVAAHCYIPISFLLTESEGFQGKPCTWRMGAILRWGLLTAASSAAMKLSKHRLCKLVREVLMKPSSTKPIDSVPIWMRTDPKAILLFLPQKQQLPEVWIKYLSAVKQDTFHLTLQGSVFPKPDDGTLFKLISCAYSFVLVWSKMLQTSVTITTANQATPGMCIFPYFVSNLRFQHLGRQQ